MEPMYTETGVTVFVPHTIVVVNHCLHAWYFSSLKDGQFKRKKNRNVRVEEILKVFTKQGKLHKVDCVAQYTWAYTAEVC